MFSVEKIKSLNDLEFLVYDYVIKNRNTVTYMRIRELADEAHVSTTTVLRFCKKMGCDGFSEFKIKLKMYLEKDEEINIKNDKTVILEFINRSNSDEFEKELEKAAEIIKEARHIFCVGIGSSGAIADYASRYFAGIGKFSIPITDPFYPTEGIEASECVSIVFTVSGETPTVIEHMIRMKKKGAKLISITNSKNCTVAKMADLQLAYYVQDEKKGFHQLTTQIPVLYIIEDIGKRIIL